MSGAGNYCCTDSALCTEQPPHPQSAAGAGPHSSWAGGAMGGSGGIPLGGAGGGGGGGGARDPRAYVCIYIYIYMYIYIYIYIHR